MVAGTLRIENSTHDALPAYPCKPSMLHSALQLPLYISTMHVPVEGQKLRSELCARAIWHGEARAPHPAALQHLPDHGHERMLKCPTPGSMPQRRETKSREEWSDAATDSANCCWPRPYCDGHWEAAAARFMPDSADDDLPVPVFWNKPTASKPSTTYDVPLYHKPCQCVACASVCMRVFCNNFCSVLCFCSSMLSRVFSTFSTVRFCFLL